MKAVILAGGLGVRLRPFTEVIPKPLLPIGEKAILEIQIEHLKKYGFDEIYVATNYKSEYIENFFGDGSKYGIKLMISKETKPLGTVGPLTLLKKQLNQTFLVMNGDILTLMNFSKFYKFAMEKGADLTIATKEIITPFQFGNIYSNGDYVTDIEEKPNIKTKILAGIYIFKPSILQIIPANEMFNMDQLIKLMLLKEIPIVKYEIYEYWLDVGQIGDYQKAQEIGKKHFGGQ